jgi:hypothetical protein
LISILTDDVESDYISNIARMAHNVNRMSAAEKERMKRYVAAENIPEQLLDDYIEAVEDEEREEITGFIVKSFSNEEESYSITVVEKMMKSCECPYFVHHCTTPCKHMFLVHRLYKNISIFSSKKGIKEPVY